ncbi:MAG: hypothetical protein LBP94_00345 [Zoogloeaceae bacterium]|nr:hypothetical protein [Zoogloeaceae bacterium]
MRETKTPGLFRILRAILIGVALFELFRYSPVIMLWLAGVHLPKPPAVAVVEEPVYYGKDGRRINKSSHSVLVGYERAEKEAISKHEDCKTWQDILERYGCFNYVDEHFTPPHVKQSWGGGKNSGKTSAQCREEVSRYYEYRLHAEHIRGNDRYHDRMYPIELDQCKYYDRTLAVDGVQLLLKTLEPLIKKAEDGGEIDDEERTKITVDLATVMALPDHPYTKHYIERSEYFFKLADGLVEPRGKERLNFSCAELLAGLKRLRQDDDADVAEMRSFERGDGVIENPNGRRTALNERRINRTWDFGRYEYNIKRAGCDRPNVVSEAQN